VKKKPFYKSILFWILLIIVIAAVGSQNSNSKNESATTSATGTSQNQKVEEVLEVDYKTLYQDYQDNPINADSKYKGKILKLTGTVGTIDREIDQRTYITFDIEFLKNVRITFKKDQESKVAGLAKGQTVTIKGKCTGTLLSTTVALTDCEIID
jgi:tRNA A37 N6-isopentenylltransferase MiaA